MAEFYTGFVMVMESGRVVHGTPFSAVERKGDKELMAALATAMFELAPGRMLHVELICHPDTAYPPDTPEANARARAEGQTIPLDED